jgi:hypothetical protein
MMPEKFRDKIMLDGINFMRTICSAYGAEEGMKLWTQIADVLDPDIKGEVLFSLLRDINPSEIIIIGIDNDTFCKVNAVRTYRTATDSTLRDAMVAINQLIEFNNLKISLKPLAKRAYYMREFRKAGCHVA